MTLQALHPSPSLSSPPDPRGLGGLIALASRGEVPLPLRQVRVRATIVGSVAHTVVEQRFANPLTTPLEVVHIFPTPPDGAVVEVELRCGERVVRAECREREAAMATYEAAQTAGHRAALLSRERDDIHCLRVTNLPPGEEVVVRIVLVEQLDAIDGTLRWRFPTTIAPRYVPGQPVGHEGRGVHPDTDAVPDASHLQPPLRLSGGMPLDLEVLVCGRPTRVSSSLHAVSLELGEGLRVAPSATATCDRDFVLAVTYAQDTQVAVRGWTDGRYTLVTLDPPLREVPPSLPRDAVFVVDISGSMSGEKIAAARTALVGAIHGLVKGDRFRLIAFDDRVEEFAPGFTAYDERAVSRADAWVGRLEPRGGTEMLPAIQAALAGDTPSGRLRTVLFITDGQALDEDRLVAAVANRRAGARFFTLGIDTAVNAALMKRLARVGGGTCELCAPSDDIEAVVARLEARFGSPLADEVTIEGGEAARPQGGVLFAGRPVSLLVAGAPSEVSARYRAAAGQEMVRGGVERTEISLHALWARERVAWLEDRLTLRPFEEEAIVPEIRRVALAAGIASRCTSFVAVEHLRVVEGERVEVVQPHELPAGWVGFGKASEADVQSVGSGASVRRRQSVPLAASAPRPLSLPGDAEEDCDEMSAPAPMIVSERHTSGAVRPLTIRNALVRRFEEAIGAAPPPPAPASPPAAPQASDLARALASSQGVDGSWGGDVLETAAALVLLVRLGHTRTAGLRQRAVKKAADWLGGRRQDPRALLALEVLEAAEEGRPLPDAYEALRGPGRWSSALGAQSPPPG